MFSREIKLEDFIKSYLVNIGLFLKSVSLKLDTIIVTFQMYIFLPVLQVPTVI